MKVTQMIVLALVGFAGTATCEASSVAEESDPTAFTSVPQALDFVAECLEQDERETLIATCVGIGDRQPHIASSAWVFERLAEFHEANDLREFYGSATFPQEGAAFKLGGHGQQFHYIHIDFVREGPIWRLADISICR